MIPLPDFANKRVAVMGLGLAGLSTARALTRSGADVLAWDDNPVGRKQAQDAGITIADLSVLEWTADLPLILTPGIPHKLPVAHPVAAAARAAHADIWCDVELLARSIRAATYVSITGTNGKSTTTALIGHVLASAGWKVQVGGNLGPPVLDLKALEADGVYVLELSSYQLERIFSLRSSVAILLNVTDDHLDRHGGLGGYVDAKRRLFELTTPDAILIIGIDEPLAEELATDAEDAGRTVIRISGEVPVDGGVGIRHGLLRDDTGESKDDAIDLGGATALRGSHNHQNAAAAWAACRILGVDPAAITDGLVSFPGLPHRQELVAHAIRHGKAVAFINDSKATNAASAGRALSSYDNIFWIAGGRGKDDGYDALAPGLDNLKAAFLIGEDALTIAAYLNRTVPALPVTCAETLDMAIEMAAVAALAPEAPAESVILLSPACASFDQFKNFGARGDVFRAMSQATLAVAEGA